MTPPPIFLGLLVLATTGLGVGLGLRRGWPAAGLRDAGGRVLEWVGWTVMLYALNVGVGALAVLLIRAAGTFLSLYLCTDVALLATAALQAVALLAWRDGRRAPDV